MRRRELGVVVALTLAFAAASACSGDDAGGNPIDASADSPDQNDGSPTTADGGDGAPANGAATVTVLENGSPFANAIVVFYTSDGTPQPPITTGADGKASMTVAAGWSVTASATSSSGGTDTICSLTTFLAIEPGDNLVATGLLPKTASPKNGTVEVVSPGTYSGASSYGWSDGCNSSGNTDGGNVALPVNDSCLEAGTLDVLGLAYQGTNGMIASAQAVGQTYVDGGSISGFAWSPITPTTLATTGTPPANATSFGYDIELYSGNNHFGGFNLGIGLGGAFTPPHVTIPNGTFLTTANWTASLIFSSAPNSNVQLFAQTPISSAFSVDFGSLPPEIHDLVATADAAGNASIAFTADGPLTGLTGMISEIDYDATSSTQADAGDTEQVQWQIVAPVAASTTLPKLTKDLVPAFVPATHSAYARALGGTTYADYRAFRGLYPNIFPGTPAPSSYRIISTSTR
ncbi:MAG: hypothetical protein ABI183_04500 [Polyangiaceae bacterium]